MKKKYKKQVTKKKVIGRTKKQSRRSLKRKYNPYETPVRFTRTIVQNWLDDNAYNFRRGKNGMLDVEGAILAMTKDHNRPKVTNEEFTMIYDVMINNLWPSGKRPLQKPARYDISTRELFHEKSYGSLPYGELGQRQIKPKLYD